MLFHTLHNLSLRPGKIVVVRADLNVPIEDGVVQDDFKISSSLPTIRYLLKHKAIVVIISHLGRPSTRYSQRYSLKPVVACLEKKLRRPVLFVNQAFFSVKNRWQRVRQIAEKLPPGSVMVLENIRFFAGEEDSRSPLARSLARCGEAFVLDGFAVAHRAAASVSGVSSYIPSYAGLLLEQEVVALQHVMQQPRQPLMLVLGGAKVESKIPILKSFVGRADAILLGGAIMTVYLAAKGFSVGGSKVDPVLGKELLSILEQGRFIMAVDAIVGDPEGNKTRVVSFDHSFSMKNSDEIIYDIGPKTRVLFDQLLSKAKTIVWNGALGKFERPAYRNGTVSLIRTIARRGDKGAYVVAGGGETVEIIRTLHAARSFSLVSTGGGAMLEFLSGEKLPGIQALELSSFNDSACL